MIRSRDLEQLPVSLRVALLAVNYSLVNSALTVLYHNASTVLCTPSFPLFHFPPDSVLRLFTASRPGCALKVSPAALLRSRRYEWGKKKNKNKSTVRLWELPVNEGYPPARESFWIYFHSICAWAGDDRAHKTWCEAMLNALGRRKCYQHSVNTEGGMRAKWDFTVALGTNPCLLLACCK